MTSMTKNKSIRNFIKLMNSTFEQESPIINDYWEGNSCAIGLQKENRLIYIASYGKNKDDYFYELELI